MTHEPLCRWQGSTEFDTVLSCDECDLIAKVREDTIAAAVQRVEAVPFLDTLTQQLIRERSLPRSRETVMTDIQRWVVYGDTDNMYPDPEGQVVRVEDHLAAYEDVKKRAYLHGLEVGQRDALARLEAYLAGCNCPHVGGALAAIKGDQP